MQGDQLSLTEDKKGALRKLTANEATHLNTTEP